MALLIQQIDKASPYLEQVIILADKNSATLGFFPHKAFEEHATRKGILVALENGQLAGYLMYRVVKSQNRAIIVHLCIDTPYRGRGIPQLLFNELGEKTLTLRGIGLTCRRDYQDATKLWKKLGFVPRHEKPGRRKGTPSELTFWWFDHGHKTLFDEVNIRKLKVVIDANVFFDFQNIEYADSEIRALMGDWLKDEVEFIITDELFVEIDKNRNSHIRKKHRRKALEFLGTKKNRAKFEIVCDQLRPLFSPNLKNNDESDLKQIAWAIADGTVSLFVTRDEGILKLYTAIFDQFGISVIPPVDLVLRLDELYRVEEYRHMRLAGTNIKQRRIHAGEYTELAQHFQQDTNENRSIFLKTLKNYLVERESSGCFVAEDDSQIPLILFAYDRSNPNQLIMPLLRIDRSNPDLKLLRYLLLQFISTCAREGRNFVYITDPYLQDVVKEALQEDAFIQIDNGWLKPIIPLAKPTQEIATYLDRALNIVPEARPYYQLHVKLLQDSSSYINLEAMSEVERIFWPVKITNADIPTISIPINSTWAYWWFDEKLAIQTLFGSHQERAFNREGVYYSAATAPNVTLPGRIMWYVTKDKRILGTQAIRACSRLDDIVIGKPKDLFRQYRHLGIYEWHNVSTLVDGDLDKEIVAYRFSDTQLFINPVAYSEWQEITQQMKGKNPPIQSPAVMPRDIFELIYKLGMEMIE